MTDPLQDQAQAHFDAQGREAKREELARNIITSALYGDNVESDAMLDRLGLPQAEYLSEYDLNPESVADAYYQDILAELDAKALDRALDVRLNR